MSERSGGYGSSWKKWLLVYGAVGIVLYAVVYFVFIHHGGSGGSGGLYSLMPIPGSGS
jgi:drug/metabolite transporter (DMT)-like permease